MGRCIQIRLGTLEEMGKGGRPIPAGFSCWPGGSRNLVLPGSSAGK